MTNPTMEKTVVFQGMPGNCSFLPTSSTLGSIWRNSRRGKPDLMVKAMR